MIFSKNIEKCCAYCTHADPIILKDQVLCPKMGIVRADFCCRKFLYSPLKRSPAPHVLKKETFSPDEFKID